MRNLSLIFALVLGLVFAAPAAQAGAAPSCGVTGTTGVNAITFDPFSGSPATNVNVALTLTRAVGTGGQKTQQVDFYFVKAPGAPAIDITYLGTSVLYTAPGPNILSIPPPGSGTIFYNFGGAAQPDTTVINIVVTIPAGTDLSSGNPLGFDVKYICKGTGGMADVDTPAVQPNAVVVQVDVPEALQVSYAGPALHFGEIGMVTNAQAPTHVVSGQFNIRSTSPYSIDVSSLRGYLMTYPSGPTTTPSIGTIKYSLSFLGQTKSNAAPVFTQVKCPTAGVASVHTLAISATLQEGGDGKTPSSNYSDMLTVTVAPLAVPAGPTAPSCS